MSAATTTLKSSKTSAVKSPGYTQTLCYHNFIIFTETKATEYYNVCLSILLDLPEQMQAQYKRTTGSVNESVIVILQYVLLLKLQGIFSLIESLHQNHRVIYYNFYLTIMDAC